MCVLAVYLCKLTSDRGYHFENPWSLLTTAKVRCNLSKLRRIFKKCKRKLSDLTRNDPDFLSCNNHIYNTLAHHTAP